MKKSDFLPKKSQTSTTLMPLDNSSLIKFINLQHQQVRGLIVCASSRGRSAFFKIKKKIFEKNTSSIICLCFFKKIEVENNQFFYFFEKHMENCFSQKQK